MTDLVDQTSDNAGNTLCATNLLDIEQYLKQYEPSLYT